MFTIFYFLGSINIVQEEDAKKFLDEFNKIIQHIDYAGIFFHNVIIALPMFIPGFGIIWGLFSSWSTGYAFAALSSLNPSITIHPLWLLYLTPFGLLELTSYSIAMSRSFLILYDLLIKTNFRNNIKMIILEIILVVLFLWSLF